MLRDVSPGTALSRLLILRTALTIAVFACATIGFSQSPAPSTPAPAPDTQPATPAADPQQTVPAVQAPGTQAPATLAPAAPASTTGDGAHADKPTAEEIKEMAVKEDQLRQQLAGKTFYLRGGYQDNTLHFNEKGDLEGSSPKASYTLSMVQIDRVKVDKHHVELEGVRYGLHFLGAMAADDQSANVDRVKLTSKKKPLKITIDRELVVAPKKPKAEKPDKKAKQAPATAKPALAEASTAQLQAPAPLVDAPSPSQEQPAAAATEAGVPLPSAQTQTAQARPASRSLIPFFRGSDADRNNGAVSSQQESDRMLRTAIDHIFSPSIDDRMVETLPDYWKLYYKAVAEKAVYRPSDPAVLRVNQVDTKPRLTTGFEPPSNEYAQNNGVAGMAMYHVIVGTDGRPQEVAIGRPIGFGLDENAVESIRKASFEPGMKDGKPVPVEVDLTVQFRIYSKRTAGGANQAAGTDNPTTKVPILPGPYSVNQPNLNQPPQQ